MCIRDRPSIIKAHPESEVTKWLREDLVVNATLRHAYCHDAAFLERLAERVPPGTRGGGVAEREKYKAEAWVPRSEVARAVHERARAGAKMLGRERSLESPLECWRDARFLDQTPELHAAFTQFKRESLEALARAPHAPGFGSLSFAAISIITACI